MFGRGLLSIVVGEFGEGKERFPIILLVVAVHSKVLFQNLIRSFCLSIGLRVEGGREVLLNVEVGKVGAPKVGGEGGATVGSDVERKTVESVDVLKEELSKFGSGGGFFGGDEVSHFGEAIDEDENGVITGGGRRKFDDVIHGNRFPRSGGNGRRGWRRPCFLCRGAFERAQVSQVLT